jgi:hypothetical protein
MPPASPRSSALRTRRCREEAVVSMLQITATGQACPAALDPGVEFFAPRPDLHGRVQPEQLLRHGLVNALAASH